MTKAELTAENRKLKRKLDREFDTNALAASLTQIELVRAKTMIAHLGAETRALIAEVAKLRIARTMLMDDLQGYANDLTYYVANPDSDFRHEPEPDNILPNFVPVLDPDNSVRFLGNKHDYLPSPAGPCRRPYRGFFRRILDRIAVEDD